MECVRYVMDVDLDYCTVRFESSSVRSWLIWIALS